MKRGSCSKVNFYLEKEILLCIASYVTINIIFWLGWTMLRIITTFTITVVAEKLVKCNCMCEKNLHIKLHCNNKCIDIDLTFYKNVMINMSHTSHKKLMLQ